MSSLAVNRYRRCSKDNTFDSDPFGNDFELFDPWTDANSVAPTSFRWIKQPKLQKAQEETVHAPPLQTAKYGEKFRVKLDVSGYDPETISTDIEGRHLVIEVTKKHHHGDSKHAKEKKLYDLPENVYEHADADHLVSYVTPNNTLVVDVPLRNHEHEQRYLHSSKEASESQHLLPYGQHRDQSFNYHHFHTSSFTPKIVHAEGQKKLHMSLPMKSYRPEDVKVAVKNNDLIVQGKHISRDNQHSENTFFYKSIALPPGTQTEHLQSQLTHDGNLQIEAPFIEWSSKH